VVGGWIGPESCTRLIFTVVCVCVHAKDIVDIWSPIGLVSNS